MIGFLRPQEPSTEDGWPGNHVLVRPPIPSTSEFSEPQVCMKYSSMNDNISVKVLKRVK